MKTRVVTLFILMVVLLLAGLPLVFGEMPEWNLLTFIIAKAIGLVSISIGYYIYYKEFKYMT
jgi:drug/metabolite transporter (DMT)-like permease